MSENEAKTGARGARMGRPEFRVTPAIRRKVEQCVAAGMSHQKIGLVLGIDRHTVEKHFREELDRGSALIQAEAMGLLLEAARKGNVSAQKKLFEVASASAAAQEVKTWMEGDGKKAEKIGKKEQAQRDAQSAGEGSDWGTDLQFNGGLPN